MGRRTTTDPHPAPATDARRVLLAFALVLAAVALLLLILAVHQVLLLVFCGVLLGVLLHGLGEVAARWVRLPPPIAVPAVLVTGGVAVTLLALGWGETVARQSVALLQALPATVHEARAELMARPWTAQIVTHLPPTDELVAAVDVGRITGVFSTVMGAMAGLFVVLFVGTYAALAPRRYVDNAVLLLPPDHRARALEIASACHRALKTWLLGRLLDAGILTIMAWIGLWALGFPYAVPLALITGASAFVPYLGPLIAAAPVLLVAVGMESPSAIWQGLLFYTAIQLLEGYLVTPLIEQRVVDLPPAVVLSVQAVMAVLAGVVGVLLATPLTVVIVVLVQTLYLQDRLREDVHVIGDPER